MVLPKVCYTKDWRLSGLQTPKVDRVTIPRFNPWDTKGNHKQQLGGGMYGLRDVSWVLTKSLKRYSIEQGGGTQTYQLPLYRYFACIV